MKIFGYISAFVVTIIVSTLYSGFALSKLWGWFVVPSLGAAPLTVGYAIGIAMVVSFLTYEWKPSDKNVDWADKLLAHAAGVALARPSFALLFGWVITLFL